MNICFWLLVIVLLTFIGLLCRRLRLFFMYEPDDPGRYEARRRLVEAFHRRLWNELGCAGPKGRPLRLALIGAEQAKRLFYLTNDMKGPVPDVVTILMRGGGKAPACWGCEGSSLDTFDVSSVDAVLIMPWSSDWSFRQELSKRLGDKVPIIDMDREMSFVIHLPEALSGNNRLLAAAREDYIRLVWKTMGYGGQDGVPLRIAVFGVGMHTHWLAEVTQSVPKGPSIVALVDDKASSGPAQWTAPVIRPNDLNVEDIDAILLSSDSLSEVMRMRCLELYGTNVQLIDMYEELVPGPYFKI